MGFVGRGQLHQFHTAGAPGVQGAHPGAGAAFVAGFHVFVAAPLPVALHQPETLGVGGGERRDQHLPGVLQRAPQPFAFARGHHQAVGVMHLGAEVVLARLVFTKQEHAGQRRNAQRLDGACAAAAHKDARTHSGHRLRARLNVEAVSPGGAGRIHERVHGGLRVAGLRAHQPELGKARKFLALAAHGVNGQAPGRQAVLLARAQRPEVAGALEDHQFVLVRGRIQVVVQPKACKPQVAPALGLHLVFAVVKVGRAVGDVARALGRHLVDEHRLTLVQTEVEEHGLKRQLLGTPQGAFGAPANVAHLVVIQRGERRGQAPIGSAVGLRRTLLGQLGDVVQVHHLRVDTRGHERGTQCHGTQPHPVRARKKGGKNSLHASTRANPVPA